jgi:hypothetical protein
MAPQNFEIVQRDEGAKGDAKEFEPIPKRWVIERTIGWFISWTAQPRL